MSRAFKDINEFNTWQEMNEGCNVYESATSQYFNTGEWRVDMPTFIAENANSVSSVCLYAQTAQYL